MDASKTPSKTAEVTYYFFNVMRVRAHCRPKSLPDNGNSTPLEELPDTVLRELAIAIANEHDRRLDERIEEFYSLTVKHDNLTAAYRDLHVAWYSIPAFIRKLFEVKEDE